jgi:hypothetical protein
MASDTSVWKVLGIGCLVLAVFGLLLGIAGGVWVYKSAKRVGDEMRDPDARTQKVKEVLGVDELPEGYHAMVAFSIPFVLDIAILSDREPGSDGMIRDFGERGFIYIQFIRAGQDEQDLRDYFEGRTSDPRVLRDNNINIDVDEIIARGVIALDDASLMYVAQRGSVQAQGFKGEGITSLTLIDCPEDKRLRMGVWFTPDPAPEAAVGEMDLTGTPADEAALAAFMGRFRYCD